MDSKARRAEKRRPGAAVLKGGGRQLGKLPAQVATFLLLLHRRKAAQLSERLLTPLPMLSR
jgi:hypothetical protein